MAHAVETMAYANEVPWHGLGVNVKPDLSPKQMMKAAGVDWTVSKRRMVLTDIDGNPITNKNGGHIEVPNEYALTRDSDNSILSVVGSSYKPVQNEEAFDFFTKFVQAGKMKMETAGSLWGGRYVWGLARIGKDFKLVGGDDVHSYLLLMSPHVHGKAMQCLFTPIRVVCNNTLTYSLRKHDAEMSNKNKKTNEEGSGSFRMIHSQVFNDSMKKTAELTLGIAQGQVDYFNEVATLLTKKRAKPEEVTDFFHEILQFDPKEAKVNKKGDVRVPLMLPKLESALLQAPGQDMKSAAGTWWGAVNAVTWVVDHEMGRDRGTSLRNAWVGKLAKLKRAAVQVAVDRAKKK